MTALRAAPRPTLPARRSKARGPRRRLRGTFGGSARQCWDRSASNDSYRRRRARRRGNMHRPCAKGCAASRRPSARNVLSWAIRPSATIARSCGKAWMAPKRKGRQRRFLQGSACSAGERTHRVGDRAIPQREAVVGAPIVDSCGEAEFAQCRIEQIARPVAGKRRPGAVAPRKPGATRR